MRKHTIEVNREQCIGCGLCRADCPVNNISILDKKAVILSSSCIQCGHCVAICPKAAVSMTGFEEPPYAIDAAAGLSPEAVLQAIRSRRSIRRFTDRPVSPDIIHKIIEAGRWTPTASNAQDVSYLVLHSRLQHCEAIAVRLFRRFLPFARLVSSMARNVPIDDHFFFKKAPAAILVLANNRLNGALAASQMETMAEACGLGVLYSGFFSLAANRSPSLRKALALKRGEKVVTTLVVGYPNVTYHRTAQREPASVRRL